MRRVKKQRRLRHKILRPWFRARRIKMGWSQRSLAEFTGASVWLIRKYEIGGRFSQRDIPYLREIFDTLGLSFEEFLHEFPWDSQPRACWKTDARDARRVKIGGLKSAVVGRITHSGNTVRGKKKIKPTHAFEITLTMAIRSRDARIYIRAVS